MDSSYKKGEKSQIQSQRWVNSRKVTQLQIFVSTKLTSRPYEACPIIPKAQVRSVREYSQLAWIGAPPTTFKKLNIIRDHDIQHVQWFTFIPRFISPLDCHHIHNPSVCSAPPQSLSNSRVYHMQGIFQQLTAVPQTAPSHPHSHY